MNKDSKIFVTGHTGLVGSAICRALAYEGYTKVITAPHSKLELRNEAEVRRFIAKHQPEYVFLCAAIVGGINANMAKPVDFLLGNLQIQNNVIAASMGFVQKLLFLGSSCIYPRDCPQPMQEKYLLSGPLEPTNQWYALAKLTGIKLCEAYRAQYNCNFINVIPCNLYGYGDNYDPQRSHVIPALIRKFHDAAISKHTKQIKVWGHPETRREFLHADDLAEACVLLMREYDESNPINVGAGRDISIWSLVRKLSQIVNVPEEITISFDQSQPAGVPRKLLDSSSIQDMGWEPATSLDDGLKMAYVDFLNRYGKRQKVWARKTYDQLVQSLGAKCVECGEVELEKLSLDHIDGKDWTACKKDLSARVCIYRREAKAGLLQVLCRKCNSRKGDPRRHLEEAATEEPERIRDQDPAYYAPLDDDEPF
jgi:GDP-L-fucose synthase